MNNVAARKDRPALTQQEREVILVLHSAGLGRNAISRRVGRSAGIVSRVVHAAGRDFDTRQTATATYARSVDLYAIRVDRGCELMETGLAAMVAAQTPAEIRRAGRLIRRADRLLEPSGW